MKHCNHCSKDKKDSEFYKGRNFKCKECDKKARLKYYYSDKAKVKPKQMKQKEHGDRFLIVSGIEMY